MRVRATLGSTANTIVRKNITRRKSQSHYISRVRGGAPIHPTAMEVCTLVKVTNILILPALVVVC
jgi:hypothetical protein